jgi:ribonuclease D
LAAAAPAQPPKLERAGLSAVCAALLGCQLDKTPQMSDWERRPLTAEQRHYAALDAHCLLELYELMLR